MKIVLKNYLWPVVLGFVVGVAMITSLLAMFATAVKAATYNSIFNNIEQGPGSTASPTIQVSDGLTKKPPAQSQAPTLPAAAEPVPSTAAEAALAPAADASSGARRFRLGLLGHMMGQNVNELKKPMLGGGTLSAAYFPIRDLGVSAFGGTGGHKNSFVGGEVELVPVRLTLFGLDHFIEAGALAGVSTLGRNYGHFGSVHAGGRVTVNFGPQIGLTAGIRTNLTGRTDFTYTMAEAGLAVRL